MIRGPDADAMKTVALAFLAGAGSRRKRMWTLAVDYALSVTVASDIEQAVAHAMSAGQGAAFVLKQDEGSTVADARSTRVDEFAAAMLALWARFNRGDVDGDAYLAAVGREFDRAVGEVPPEARATLERLKQQAIDRATQFADDFASGNLDWEGASPEQRTNWGNMLAGAAWAGALAASVYRDDGGDGVYTWVTQEDPAVCAACDELGGQQFTLDELPGWPGESDFGGFTDCGPNCRCYLEPFGSEGKQARRLRLKYSEDQPRDEHGRWTDGGGASAIASAPDKFEAGHVGMQYVSPDGHAVGIITSVPNSAMAGVHWVSGPGAGNDAVLGSQDLAGAKLGLVAADDPSWQSGIPGSSQAADSLSMAQSVAAQDVPQAPPVPVEDRAPAANADTWENDLTADQKWAVDLWTNGSYGMIRDAALGKRGGDTLTYRDFAAALRTAPTYNGPVDRGISNLSDGDFRRITGAQDLQMGAPGSFSKDAGQAIKFASGDAGTHSIVLQVLPGHNGADISTLSRHYSEQEVVMPKGHSFTVEHVEIHARANGGKYAIMQLRATGFNRGLAYLSWH